MYGLPTKRSRREITELNLTPMIDIFSLIVIFLIKGTVFADLDIPVPKDVKLPKSMTNEGIETAPRMTIVGTEVQTTFYDRGIPIASFRDPQNSEVRQLKSAIQTYVQRLPSSVKEGGILLNVVADKNTAYRDLFDTVKVFREAGIQSLLFVALAEKEAE